MIISIKEVIAMPLLDEDAKNIFGSRLRSLRTNFLHMNQKEFAAFLEIPQPTVSAYESGKIKPTVDALINVSEKCDISTDWLCGRTRERHLNSLGDVMAVLFEIYEMKDFSPTTEFQDTMNLEETNETDDNKRNWVQIRFYYNNQNPNNKYNDEICNMIKTVSEMYSRLSHYDYPLDYYEAEKKKLIESYAQFPITTIEFEQLPEKERQELKYKLFLEEYKKNNNRV